MSGYTIENKRVVKVRFKKGEAVDVAVAVDRLVDVFVHQDKLGCDELEDGFLRHVTVTYSNGTESPLFISFRRFRTIKGQPWSITIGNGYGSQSLRVDSN